MAWSQNNIQAQWAAAATVTVTAGSNSGNSDAITLTDGPWNREVIVKADAATPVSGDTIDLYWISSIDVDNDTTADTTNQGTYLGTMDVFANDPAVKSFGLFTSVMSGYLYADATNSSVNVVVSAVIAETVYAA